SNRLPAHEPVHVMVGVSKPIDVTVRLSPMTSSVQVACRLASNSGASQLSPPVVGEVQVYVVSTMRASVWGGGASMIGAGSTTMGAAGAAVLWPQAERPATRIRGARTSRCYRQIAPTPIARLSA